MSYPTNMNANLSVKRLIQSGKGDKRKTYGYRSHKTQNALFYLTLN
ncbi:hypothetical protein [Dyadobacter sp. NIV53]|nr:hypothetical protein [Dyadobacter sp. NIV53]